MKKTVPASDMARHLQMHRVALIQAVKKGAPGEKRDGAWYFEGATTVDFFRKHGMECPDWLEEPEEDEPEAPKKQGRRKKISVPQPAIQSAPPTGEARKRQQRTEHDHRAFVTTKTHLGHLLGISYGALTNYIDRGMPGKVPDGYCVPACVQWMIEYYRAREKQARAADGYAPNAKALAEILGTDKKTAKRWVRESGTKRVDRGYPIAQLVTWLREEAGAVDLDGAPSEALERWRLARACREEMALDKDKGRLVDKEEILQWWEERVAVALRESIQALETRYGADAGDVVRDAIARVEREMAEERDAE